MPSVSRSLMGMRGQSATEFVLVLGAVIAIVAAVMLRSYAETEFTTAFAAARLGASDAVAANASLSLAAVDCAISGRNVTFIPKVFNNHAPAGDSPAVRSAVLKRLRDSFSPDAPLPSMNFSTAFHDYYVAFG